MSLAIAWTTRAERDMRRLDPEVACQVRQAIQTYAETGQGDLARLRPPLEGYRMRVRDWRVLLDIDRAAAKITVHHVEHRSKVYKQQ